MSRNALGLLVRQAVALWTALLLSAASGCATPEAASLLRSRSLLVFVSPDLEGEMREVLARGEPSGGDLPELLPVVSRDPFEDLESEGEGVAFASRPLNAPGDLAPGLEMFWRRDELYLLLAPAFDPVEDLSYDQALEILEAGGKDRFLAVKLGDRLPPPPDPVKVLAVDGSYPTAKAVRHGTYRFGTASLLAAGPSLRAKKAASTLAKRLEGEASPPAEPLACVAVGGDIMLARRVSQVASRVGWERITSDSGPLLSLADVAFVNLESPLGVLGSPLPGKMIWFRAPPEAVKALAAAGIDIVTVANNHILDYDSENFLETLEILERSDIEAVGGGPDIHWARKPVVIEAGDLKIAFLAYSEFASPDLYWSMAYPRTFMAEEDVPGVAPLRIDYVKEDLAAAEALADVTFVAFHWGAEDTNEPLPFKVDQRSIADQTLSAGATAVLGFHPHALQGIDYSRPGRPAFYSFGNLVMDQKREIQKESVVALLWVTRDGVAAFNLVPLYIEDVSPVRPSPEVAERIMRKMKDLSSKLSRSSRTG